MRQQDRRAGPGSAEGPEAHRDGEEPDQSRKADETDHAVPLQLPCPKPHAYRHEADDRHRNRRCGEKHDQDGGDDHGHEPEAESDRGRRARSAGPGLQIAAFEHADDEGRRQQRDECGCPHEPEEARAAEVGVTEHDQIREIRAGK